MANEETDACLAQIRTRLEGSLPPNWSFETADVEVGIGVLRSSLDDYLTKGDWTKVANWLLDLAESIAILSVALSVEWARLPLREGATAKVDRIAFFLAAILVCNACHGEGIKTMGRPCSNVKVDFFPPEDRPLIRALFKEAYGPSGLLG